MSNHDQVLKFISSHGIFSTLPSYELEALVGECRLTNFGLGEYITSEGDDELSGFMVMAGRVAMTKTSLSGKELVVELVGPGDIFGLFLALQRPPALLSARAQSAVKVVLIPFRTLMVVLNDHPDIYKEMVAQLLLSLHSSYRIARGLAHDRVETRIAAILSSMALKFPEAEVRNESCIIDITRQQLADLTGTSTETAIRITRELQRQGMIGMKHPGRIEILDFKALHLLAEG